MREKWIRLWRDFRFPLIVAFGTLPVPLVVFAYYAPMLLSLVWVLPVSYILLDAVSTRIPGKWRICYGVFEILLLAGAGWLAGKTAGNWTVLLVPGAYCVLLLWGLVLSSGDRNDQIGPLLYLICIGVHLGAQLLQYSARILENPALDPVRFWNAASFFCSALLALITLNQANLKSSTNGRQDASRVMQRKNLLLVLGLFVLGMLIASVPALVNLMGELFEWLVIGILWLIYVLSGKDGQSSGEAAEGGGNGEMMLPGADEVRQTPQWLTIILTVIVLVLVAAVAVYALYFFGKKLIIFAKFLTRISGKYLHAVSEDYVDEITDTREGRENTSEARNRKNRLSSLDERRLPPDQRIRYRFKRLMQKHPEWDSGATAREKLTAEAAPIYERVRYSPYSVTEEEAQRFLAETKKGL